MSRVHETMPLLASILVVCSGNHFRSPVGEALLRAALGPKPTVNSAGLAALEGCPPDPEARRLMAERGLDISGHRGHQFIPAMALSADLVLVMEEAQKEDCERIVPSARGRIFLLGHWRPPGLRDIPDPFRKGPEAARRAVEQIAGAVADWLPCLARREVNT